MGIAAEPDDEPDGRAAQQEDAEGVGQTVAPEREVVGA